MSTNKRVYRWDKKLRKIVQVAGPPRTHSARGVPLVNDAYAKKPIDSLALGVAPHQVGDMRERVRESGAAGVEVTPGGNVVITSRKGRAKLLRHLGYVDRDGGYGD